MSWEFDAPTGVYKNHALSSDIRKEVAADAVFSQFLTQETGYGKGRGASVTITRIMQLPLAGRVNELDDLPSGRSVVDTKTQAVSQWGFKVEMTEFEEDLAHFDLRNRQQQMLRDQMLLTMDKMSADALKQTLVKAIPTSAAAITFDTDGTPSTQATNNLAVAHLRIIHDYMRQTLKSPKFRNGQYIGILSTRGARGIKNDPEYKDWLAPDNPGPFTTGRMKDVEGFALFETNHDFALDDDIGLNGILGEAIFFGADAGFFATVMDPEIRAGLPRELGTKREVGWVGTIEAGLTWDIASKARVVHVASS